MAQQTLPRARSAAHPLVRESHWLIIGVLTVLTLLGAFGNAWDLYWHIMIGRDTFWIPPHTMMYSAVALSGIIAAAVVLAHTLRPVLVERTSGILMFRAPLGFFVLGLGALQMVISAPFDDWWHRAYGIDVTVWSPPHLVGFSGAAVMLAGLIIATTSERQRAASLTAGQERWYFWLLALLFALVVRWITFLNSTSLPLSWALEPDGYAIVGPWAAWWGLWASLFLTWTLVASARCVPGAAAWRLPLTVVALALLLRLLEFGVSALGFRLVLPWGDQTMHKPFRMLIDYDLGLWVTTVVLLLPTIVVALMRRFATSWSSLRFGLIAGVCFGLLFALQFLMLRPIFELPPIDGRAQVEVLVSCLAMGLLGGVIGARQGDWLATFKR